MNMLIRGLLVAGAAYAIATSPVRAAACSAGTSVFTDVPDVASFCTNTQWLKNRAVTLGCGTGSTYCPDETLTRAQMALFMNRLGT
ncbi:MAG: hypothetical protein ABI552_09815, partial [Casimicrobiaceae bacterium]